MFHDVTLIQQAWKQMTAKKTRPTMGWRTGILRVAETLIIPICPHLGSLLCFVLILGGGKKKVVQTKNPLVSM